MSSLRRKTLFKYVIPSILSNACIFLFTIVDGVFVGRGVGSDALGAVNIAMPVVMIATAINMLTSIGGCAIAAIRLISEGPPQRVMSGIIISQTCFSSNERIPKRV